MSEFSSSVPPLEESSIPEHLIPKEEWYEAYVRYGLYVGAAFQLACILAVLVLPGDKGAAAGDGGDEGVRARFELCRRPRLRCRNGESSQICCCHMCMWPP